MVFSRRSFLGALSVGASGLVAPKTFAAVKSSERPTHLSRALQALDAHGSSIVHRDVLGLVDFSSPSGDPRFQILDLGNGRVLSSYLVAHGRGSDPANTGWLQHFSNRPGSNASCKGSFVVANTYFGKHGRSRRLHGLDPENCNAASRAIVIHGADYVSPNMARNQGRVGRSLGCFSVPRKDIGEVLSRLGEGRLLFAWK